MQISEQQEKSQPQRSRRNTKENQGQQSAVSGQQSALGGQRSTLSGQAAGNGCKLAVVAALILIAAILTGCGGGGNTSKTGQTQTQSGSAVVPQSAHVVLVIEENHTFNEVMSQIP